MPDGMGGTKAHLFVPKERMACDAWNETILPAAGGGDGARAKLWMETIYLDPDTNQYYLGSNFDAIFESVGSNVMVRIPDLYADTNGDGVIDAGDVLYSLVDLAEYLTAIPTFNFDDTFQIVNGRVDGLPGMYFSTTDFVLNYPTTAEPDGLGNFTPYTGVGVVKTDHSLSAAVPEPSSILSFLALGTLGAASTLKRKLKPSKSTEKETTKVS
jgi:hypothetical protein